MEICVQGWVEDPTGWEARIGEADSVDLALQWVRVTGDDSVELCLDVEDEEVAIELLADACGEVGIPVPDDLTTQAC